MVVVSLVPSVRYMNRSGMATGTRKVANRLWPGSLPAASPLELTRQLYREENKDKPDPSGSQDMIGLLFPGISRLDYDYRHEDGIFPVHIESNCDPEIARWIEQVIHVIPVAPRPEGYNPLGEQNLDPAWIARLGQSGADCYESIVNRDLTGLGQSMNECMDCWATILPQTVRHRLFHIDLQGLLRCYQDRFPGAMYSGCGGGYLYVAADEPVPGAFHVEVRTK